MNLLQILVLAVVQGAVELLPVPSSAHVIVAEKLMGSDPTALQMTLLLVTLHTGTMFAVIAYFWKSWRATYFSSGQAFRTNALCILAATLATGIVGVTLLQFIRHVIVADSANFEIEHLFGNSRLIAAALAVAGLLIILSSHLQDRGIDNLSLRQSARIDAVQGLCLPFRGFSRSNATISVGPALGVAWRRAEEFSFVLTVVLTPAVIVKEAYRLYKGYAATTAAVHSDGFLHLTGPSMIGVAMSFLAGWVALRWLSRWLEQGRQHFFGFYCLLASLLVLWTDQPCLSCASVEMEFSQKATWFGLSLRGGQPVE